MLSDTITLPVDGVDSIRPFSLAQINIGGHAVRLERVLTAILEQHNYPPIINIYLAQLITMSALLFATFKHKGITTLQIKGAGIIDTMVCDITHEGYVRAYANFDSEALINMVAANSYDPEVIIGEGYLLLVVDSEQAEERYQGVVELQKGDLISSFEHYFQQSAQLDTAIRISIEPPAIAENSLQWRDSQHLEKFGWRAGGIMIQQVPSTSLIDEDHWHTGKLHLDTVTHEELIDGAVAVDKLLYQLFHEFGVIVFDSIALEAHCRCTSEKITSVLKVMECDPEETYEVICEFCGKVYDIKPGVV